MKLRNREVNVFSMSALDLFASAMGAFMFLAIIALPFFPNTGSSPESISEIKKELDAFDVLDGFEVNLFADESHGIANPLSVRTLVLYSSNP